MKKIFLYVLMCFSIITLFSCKKAEVAGKHFRFSKSDVFFIDFSPDSNKVYYIADIVGDYSIDKNDVIIIVDGKETIRLRYQENALYPYKYDKDGKRTKEIDFSSSFIEDGTSDFFTNVFANTEKEYNGTKIKFTKDAAFVGDYNVDYGFNSITGEYTVANCEGTYIREKFLENVYMQILKKALDGNFSELSYSDAFWLRQATRKIDSELMDVYLTSFYAKEYEEAGSDDFALHNLVSEKQKEVQEKINQLDTKKTFNIVMPASLKKYDFKNSEFIIQTSLDIPEIPSTFSECDYPVKVLFGQKEWNGVNWLSDVNSQVKVKMQEDKAAELSKNGDGNYLIVYAVSPIMLYDQNLSDSEHRYELKGWSESYVRECYAQYYEVLSAELLDGSSLKTLGKAEVVKVW